jgi:hypothetical protein
MMEKEAGRALLSLFYPCTIMYDGEGSRKSSLSLSVLSVYNNV